MQPSLLVLIKHRIRAIYSRGNGNDLKILYQFICTHEPIHLISQLFENLKTCHIIICCLFFQHSNEPTGYTILKRVNKVILRGLNLYVQLEFL